MIALERDLDDQEIVFLGTAAEGKRDRVADGDAGWQADMVVMVARTAHEPVAAFGQHVRAAGLHRYDRVRLIGSGGQAETRGGDQKAGNPCTKRHQPSLFGSDMLNLPWSSLPFNQARKPR